MAACVLRIVIGHRTEADWVNTDGPPGSDNADAGGGPWRGLIRDHSGMPIPGLQSTRAVASLFSAPTLARAD